MSSSVAVDTVLVATPWCVVREQEDRYLVYNSRTDELHLLPPSGYYAYRLCDGCNSVGEIGAILAEDSPEEPAVLHDAVRGFFGMLVARGILEAEA